MTDRNRDLARALGAFKVALIAHLASQPGVQPNDPKVKAAAERVLSKAASALAEESFMLEEQCVQNILRELMYGE